MADLRQEKPGFVAWTSSLAFFISCGVCGFASIRQNVQASRLVGARANLVPLSLSPPAFAMTVSFRCSPHTREWSLKAGTIACIIVVLSAHVGMISNAMHAAM